MQRRRSQLQRLEWDHEQELHVHERSWSCMRGLWVVGKLLVKLFVELMLVELIGWRLHRGGAASQEVGAATGGAARSC